MENDRISEMNTWAVSLMRYNAGAVKWTKNEFEKLTGKLKK